MGRRGIREKSCPAKFPNTTFEYRRSSSCGSAPAPTSPPDSFQCWTVAPPYPPRISLIAIAHRASAIAALTGARGREMPAWIRLLQSKIGEGGRLDNHRTSGWRSRVSFEACMLLLSIQSMNRFSSRASWPVQSCSGVYDRTNSQPRRKRRIPVTTPFPGSRALRVPCAFALAEPPY